MFVGTDQLVRFSKARKVAGAIDRAMGSVYGSLVGRCLHDGSIRLTSLVNLDCRAGFDGEVICDLT